MDIPSIWRIILTDLFRFCTYALHAFPNVLAQEFNLFHKTRAGSDTCFAVFEFFRTYIDEQNNYYIYLILLFYYLVETLLFPITKHVF